MNFQIEFFYCTKKGWKKWKIPENEIRRKQKIYKLIISRRGKKEVKNDFS